MVKDLASGLRSFSYDIKDAAIVTIAEDKAKEQGKSFSKYILELIKDDLKKKEAQITIPILNNEHQLTTDEYKPFLYSNDIERKRLWNYIDSCDNDKLTSFTVQINETHKKIASRRNREVFKIR